ncbi:hypothetical protein XF14_02215 [Burkholderia gladioli]|nr:hypothetical protein XF14_02215 [Burkholderia gladioli]
MARQGAERLQVPGAVHRLREQRVEFADPCRARRIVGLERVELALRDRDADRQRVLARRRVPRGIEPVEHARHVGAAPAPQVGAREHRLHLGIVRLDAQPGFQVGDRQAVGAGQHAHVELAARIGEQQQRADQHAEDQHHGQRKEPLALRCRRRRQHAGSKGWKQADGG